MLTIYREILQGSDDWFKLRSGMVGASSISKIITSTGKRSTQRSTFLYQIAAEMITGEKTETYSNNNMQNGIKMESNTRKEFMLKTGLEVEQVGGIINSEIEGAFISPDGLIVDEDAGLELKSVIPSTQVKYLDNGKLPTEYILQCQMSLFVTGYPVWWFCSHCPGFMPFIVKVERDEVLIKIIETELSRFVSDAKELVERVKGK